MIAFLYDEHTASWPCIEKLREKSELNQFSDPNAFIEVLGAKPYLALLIDYQLAHQDDFRLLKSIKTEPQYNGCPIVVVSPDNCEEKKMNSLTAGATDFYSNQMRLNELEIRLKNKMDLFKRSKNIFKLGSVKLSVADLKTYLFDRQVDLTLIEMKLLLLLMKNYPSVISKEVLVSDVWPGQIILSTTINTHLYNLRTKFKSWEYEIITYKSKGYCLVQK